MKWTNTLKHFFLFLICFQLMTLGLPIANNEVLAKPRTSKKLEMNPEILPGLAAKVDVVEDEFGTPHIFGKNFKDVFFMQGFLHARDRFFQMDVTRRTVEGSLAELLGVGPNNSILSSDVQLRGLNLKASVTKALSMMQKETRQFLKAYSDGVNAYLKDNPLPAEYQALKITQKRMWTETDCLLVGKGLALSLSFDTGDINNTLALQAYQAAGMAQGFDGSALFFEDVFRVAPFDPSFSIPDATGRPFSTTGTKANNQRLSAKVQEQQKWAKHISDTIKPETLEMAQDYLNKVKNIPLLANGAEGHDPDRGSNWFILSGRLTDSGAPLLNNDPHLGFNTPPIWYQVQLNVTKGKGKKLLNVTGVSLAGVPGVVLGHNDDIAWGATTSNFDVTDVYQEQIKAQFGSVSIIHDGKEEPVIFRDEFFRANQVVDGMNDNLVMIPASDSVPGRFPSVPRRNGGPIVSINLSAQTALTLQYTGFGPTLEVETFLGFNRAKNVDDFKKALEFFDVGSQNFSVITTTGDMAYFTTGEVPIREDLEAGKVNGAPPFLIRNGVTGNEWMSIRNRQPNQVLQYEILPFNELPQVVNPTNGFVVTANADPTGITANNNPFERKRATGGIYYLAATGYASGARNARLTKDIQEAIASGQKITVEMARRFQADVRMRDAEILMPFIQQAFANATAVNAPTELSALAKDAGISEAVNRFKTWDFSTPTGLKSGYDSFVAFGSDPSQKQIDDSVSTTIYSLWRSQMVRDTIDATLQSMQLTRLPDNATSMASLRNLLDKFSSNKGKGVSGIFFFGNTGLDSASPEVQRDFVILRSLRRALDSLAGPDFALAFQGSTKQSDYRWGALHRVSFPSMLGVNTDFTIPSVNGKFQSPVPGLFGLPRDGGFDVPNASGHSVRARGVNDFTFRSGPSKRTTIVMKPGAIDFTTAIPGGQSAAPNSKFFDNLLQFWLTADVYPVRDITKPTAAPNEKRTTFAPFRKE
ncbi:MAG: penicillin acylase family protein [Acidobacteria bacterium]|nr:penicillin acylase family protein [Acidobacteriota bacterium]